MSAGDHFSNEALIRGKTAVDPKQGPKHQETLLERLRHRHNLGLDDSHAQLHAFEKKNPELLFENS